MLAFVDHTQGSNYDRYNSSFKMPYLFNFKFFSYFLTAIFLSDSITISVRIIIIIILLLQRVWCWLLVRCLFSGDLLWLKKINLPFFCFINRQTVSSIFQSILTVLQADIFLIMAPFLSRNQISSIKLLLFSLWVSLTSSNTGTFFLSLICTMIIILVGIKNCKSEF